MSMYFKYNHVITVIIIVPPEIIIPPEDITVINGSAVVFNCTVVGDPLPSISWFFSGVNLSNVPLMLPFGRFIDNVVTNTTLNNNTILSSLRLNETVSFIAGNYTCRASNSLGSINETAVLTVHGMSLCYVTR